MNEERNRLEIAYSKLKVTASGTLAVAFALIAIVALAVVFLGLAA